MTSDNSPVLIGLFVFFVIFNFVFLFKRRISRNRLNKLIHESTLSDLEINVRKRISDYCANEDWLSLVNEIVSLNRVIKENGNSSDCLEQVSNRTDRLQFHINRFKSENNILDSTISIMNNAAKEQKEYAALMNQDFSQLKKIILLNVSNLIEFYSSLKDFEQNIIQQSEDISAVLSSLDQMSEKIGEKNRLSADNNNLLKISEKYNRIVMAAINEEQREFEAIKQALIKIEDIAEKTNVLSISTSIEAARIGSKGNGFKVIAHNLKSLSSEAQSLTGIVNEILSRNTRQLDSSGKEVTQVMNLNNQVIQDLSGSILAASSRNKDIMSNTEQLCTSKDQLEQMLSEIKTNMSQLREVINSNQGYMDMYLETTNVILKGTESLEVKAKSKESSLVKLEKISEALHTYTKGAGSESSFVEDPLSFEEADELEELEEV